MPGSTSTGNTRTGRHRTQQGKTADQPRIRGRFAHKNTPAPEPAPSSSPSAGQDTVVGQRPRWGSTDTGQVTGADLLAISHPCMETFVAVTPRFDDTQRAALLAEDWGRVERRLARDKIDPASAVDPGQWRAWCDEQADILAARGDIVASVEHRSWAWYPPATQAEAEFLKRRRWQGTEADRAWFRERRYIAGQLDVDVDALTEVVTAARHDPRAVTDPVPAWFTKALESSYWGRDAIKAPPSDAATRWALWKATTDPAMTADLPRLRSDLVVFDTETTGLDSSADIINIAVTVYTHQGRKKDHVDTLLRPPADECGQVHTGGEQAVAVHGITPDMVADAPTFADLAPQLHQMMAGRTLVAHNIMFDYPKVQRHFARSGHDTLPSGPMVDTLRMARYHQPTPEGETAKTWKHTLKVACERAGLGFDDGRAHDAGYDTDRCAALFLHLRDQPLV